MNKKQIKKLRKELIKNQLNINKKNNYHGTQNDDYIINRKIFLRSKKEVENKNSYYYVYNPPVPQEVYSEFKIDNYTYEKESMSNYLNNQQITDYSINKEIEYFKEELNSTSTNTSTDDGWEYIDGCNCDICQYKV